ncbi:hypothetical protein GJA_4967 [Janthinobacterium agaricidamnosum NBRC 102515 = DSM 9628]|uniref:Uncharacterized protein n=1 Tax=Janthinobacterium agaricidamnosum NBRC 102515 = DSM 9628 TaxID=1349767 RepID=W0VCE5_9BURK|nr:hypothetical protein GJA_4967 [Janthinobacterium agaricidamnosum NBRC 102515 = DSM 9628]
MSLLHPDSIAEKLHKRKNFDVRFEDHWIKFSCRFDKLTGDFK